MNPRGKIPPLPKSFRRTACGMVAFALPLSLGACSAPPPAEYVTQVPWALVGPYIVMDSHTHTRYSDGAHTVQEIAEKAALNGCRALAITDHSDLSERAATPEYFADIAAMRRALPELLIFGGLEWNIPPYHGREHVTVLLDPALEAKLLPEFKQRYDRDDADAGTALGWLAQQIGDPHRAVLFYNHPSRKDDRVEENLADMQRWRAVNPLLVGFEGGPGHQRAAAPGSYEGRLSTEDRWDPVVAQVGGVWDRMLDEGQDIWAALASSDFHNEDMDYAPCGFSRTHVQAADRSYHGVLKALRAGSFWAEHGPLLDSFVFAVSVPGLPLPITPGETARIRHDTRVNLQIAIKRSTQAKASPLTIEIIGNGRSGQPELLHTRTLAPNEESLVFDPQTLTAGADGKSAYFRARVRKAIDDGPDLLAYSNPIRVQLR